MDERYIITITARKDYEGRDREELRYAGDRPLIGKPD